jgi:hypothetical protein
MTCGRCGTNLAPGATQCGVCFAPVNAGIVSPPLQGFGSSIPAPAPVLPTRSSPPPKPRSTGWNVAGFGGGFLTMLLVALRAVSVYHNAQVRSERAQSTQPGSPYMQRYQPAQTSPASPIMTFPGAPSAAAGPTGAPNGFAGRRDLSGMPTMPGPPSNVAADMAARQQQIQERMAADQQRLQQNMADAQQRMNTQMEASRQRMEQQMEQMRARSGASMPGPMGTGRMGGPPFGGPGGPGGFGGPGGMP